MMECTNLRFHEIAIHNFLKFKDQAQYENNVFHEIDNREELPTSIKSCQIQLMFAIQTVMQPNTPQNNQRTKNSYRI